MTNSFQISPQRQIRQATEEAAQAPEGGQPTAPQYHKKRLGGTTLDFETYDPATQLKTQQQVDSIRNLVDNSLKTVDAKVKEQSKKKEAQGKRLFEKIAQYKIDTRDIGQGARDLRKAGRPDLAEELLDSNPWLFFGLKVQEASKAGLDAVYNASNYVDANMNTLQQIEDPTVVRGIVQNQLDSYLATNYPNISNENYVGLVEPVLAKASPGLLSEINKNHAQWKGNVRNLTTLTELNQAEKGLFAVSAQDPSNTDRNALIQGKFRTDIIEARDNFIANGGTYQQWQGLASKWVKGMVIDRDGNGLNDLHDKNLYNVVIEALDFEIPDSAGLPKGTKFLDLTDENGNTFRDLLSTAKINSILLENKVEGAIEQGNTREALQFKRVARFSLNQQLQGKTGPEAQIVKDNLIEQLENAYSSNSPIVLLVRNEEGKIVEQEFNLPSNVDVQKLIKDLGKTGQELGAFEFKELQTDVIKRLATDPSDSLDDIFEQLVPGTSQWETIDKLQFQAVKVLLNKDWSGKITGEFKYVKESYNNFWRNALKEERKEAPKSDKAQVEKDFKELLNQNNLLAEELFNDFMYARLLESTEAQRADPTWWKEQRADFITAIQSDERFKNPSLADLNRDDFDPTKTVQPLYLYTRGTNDEGNPGDIKDVTLTKLRSNEAFLKENKYLLGTSQMVNYHNEQPMMSSKAFGNVYQFLSSGVALSDETLLEVSQAYKLAQTLQNGKYLSLEDFLTGQGGSNIFDWRDPNSVEYKEPFKLDNELMLNTLKRRLSNNTVGKASTIRWVDSQEGNTSNGSVNFWLEDNTNGSSNVNLLSPAKLKVLDVGFAEGTDGNFARFEVQKDSGGLKKGYIITIRHARSFGGLLKGQMLYPGNYLGMPHNAKTFQKGVDQADTPGAGPHLNLYITDAAGTRLSQQEVSKIFKEVLSPGFSF